MSNDTLPRRGLMLVLSSPSGAGKTTISRALLDGDDALELSVSATTRAPVSGVTSAPFIRTRGSVAEAQPSKRYGRMVSCRAPAVRSVSASHSPPVGEEAIEPSVCCRPS